MCSITPFFLPKNISPCLHLSIPLPIHVSVLPSFPERLSQKDLEITQGLREKLQLFADMVECVSSLEDPGSRSRLLLRGDASDLHQGEQLLQGAIHEGRGVHSTAS